ncbi:MAG: redox-sensing transcriptional repressor Rex [Tannerella sp.]|jgi:redox-sensing transcriptional repressor|nr:redox-sensing transcriptional repressor Rex [Tannerella sp.]
MTREDDKPAGKVPEPTLRRLPWYLAYVKLLKGYGETFVSSTRIAKEIDIDASQIAKDLSYVNLSGKTRVGYEINALIGTLENFLGFASQHSAFLFGAGRLGAALMRDSGLIQYGLNIVAGFDIRRKVVGSTVAGIPVFHMNSFQEKQKLYGATVGIITVPVEEAQRVAEGILAGGIRALWNFTPFRIHVPDGVVVQNTSIYAHLAVMFNRMEKING